MGVSDKLPLSIQIIDTGAGNLFSLVAAFERIAASVAVVDTPAKVSGDVLVIPGQGRFGPVMERLSSAGWPEFLRQWNAAGKAIIGICVGLQVLFEASEEDPDTAGLGWLKGKVTRLQSPKQPMVGWARVSGCKEFPAGDAYFVNSFVVTDTDAEIASTNYGERFCATLAFDNVRAFQFHPEKSGDYGSEVLKRCLI